MKRLLALLLALLLTLGAAACGGDDNDDEKSDSGSVPARAEKPDIDIPAGPPPEKLVVKDLKPGTGKAAQGGDTLLLDYAGVVYKGGKEIDSSYDRSEPFQFVLQAGEVIPGWDEGLEGMKEGGRRQLVIPPDLAYGPQGSPPDIPADATLVFVMDLLKVE